MSKLRTYILGFGLSLILTFAAFGCVFWHEMSGHTTPSHEIMVPLLVAFALLQLSVQLTCFLHVRKDKKSWDGVALAFAVFIVVILVGGTLWIMRHLSHMQEHAELEELYEGGMVTPQTQHD